MQSAGKSAPHATPRRFRIDAMTGRVLALLVAGLGAAAIYWNDRYLTAAHAMSVTAAVMAFVLLLTRRALLSAIIAAAIVGFVLAAAYIKREETDLILHAWDLFDTATWRFSPVAIALAYPFATMIAALSACAIILTPPALLWAEKPNVRRLPALAAFSIVATTAAITAHVEIGPRHLQATFPDRHLSTFYSSWPAALEALARGQLIEAARERQTPFDPAPACAPEGRPPHIILIHQESVTPPGPLKGLEYDRALDDFFRSHDGRSYGMRVETFGGASWLTEFSVLTGAASRFFGSIRHFVQIYMAGRMDDALPTALSRCGYTNMMFYPFLKGFFGSARFFETVGLKQIYDARDQKAAKDTEQDRFYYGNMLAEIERRLERRESPLFIYLQTMSAHWPYDVTFWPERKVAGGGPGTHPETNEFLRRLAMAKEDYEELRKELARRFPQERFLIVHYGDHHPLATRFFFGFDGQEVETINDALADASPAFVTYFAVDGVNYAPPPLPQVETIDSAYLGAVILEQARLPMPESWRERARLMRACDGRYALCPDRQAILRFHRRLIDSGLLIAR